MNRFSFWALRAWVTIITTALVYNTGASRAGIIIRAGANEGVSTDMFDVNQGTVVTAFSAQYPGLGGSDARSALGFNKIGFVEPLHTIFADLQPVGTIDSITFRTTSSFTLAGFSLTLTDDSNTGRADRGSSSFRLFASTDGTTYDLVSSASLMSNYQKSYGDTNITISESGSLNIPNVQFFRLEVTRATTLGSRIVELDGFAAVPAPPTFTSVVVSLLMMFGYGLTRRRSRLSPVR